MIYLKSCDGETFEVEDEYATESQTIKEMIEEDGITLTLPLTSNILGKVIEYCKRHVEASFLPPGYGAYELKAFDAEFVNVDSTTLLDLSAAANYLRIKSLLELTCQTIADAMNEMTPMEMRNTFDIGDSFKELEEEEIRRENEWRDIEGAPKKKV